MDDLQAGEAGVRERADVVVVGAGAAGLFAAVWAGREAMARGASVKIVAVDGAKKLGAKILVAGGGRCNVTHHAVDERAYAGSSPGAIRSVLRAFGVEATRAFFAEYGVELKREETGKLFPTTDDAHTVLDALILAAKQAGAELRHPWRVGSVRREGAMFVVEREGGGGVIEAPVVIIATGGMALPRSGSDGAGYGFVRGLGHTVTPVVMPALVPLVLEAGSFVRELSGLTLEASLEVRSGTGKRLMSFRNSTLCTHFGLSGPGPLDISRYYFDTLGHDPAATLVINWLPGMSGEQLDALLIAQRRKSPGRILAEAGMPERLARALCVAAFGPEVDPGVSAEHMPREARRALVTAATAMVLPVAGSRGYTYAEVTAGGVPLSEIQLSTMSSRVCPGLFVCGEICDVDGRIGGFNFQWAWASGYLAGRGASAAAASQMAE